MNISDAVQLYSRLTWLVSGVSPLDSRWINSIIKKDKPVQPSNSGFRNLHTEMWAHLNVALSTKLADLTKSAMRHSQGCDHQWVPKANRTISRLFGLANVGEPSEGQVALQIWRRCWVGVWLLLARPPKYTATDRERICYINSGISALRAHQRSADFLLKHHGCPSDR